MITKKPRSHVFWDWNGTLFDDADWCLQIINGMLAKRNIKTLDGIEEYREVFCFPIIDYYKRIGFDFSKQSFEELAEEYIAAYHSDKTGSCKLHNNAETVLRTLQNKNITQVVLSASEINNLLSQMKEFDINGYFEEILGISDIYAKSKVDIGLKYIAQKNITSALLIGDTEHDLEVANALGIDCVLVAGGHQSKEKLLSRNVTVVDDISGVLEYVC